MHFQNALYVGSAWLPRPFLYKTHWICVNPTGATGQTGESQFPDPPVQYRHCNVQPWRFFVWWLSIILHCAHWLYWNL